ncbi:MAG: DUF1552 domain-containing protein [Candidatus Solibacter usitatus]|nr:DUF1552 domain-containing protein [Candidatus Solibacter usitatus]
MTILNPRFPISRRTLLRGAGAGVGLPWLEAMMPRRADAAKTQPVSPVRIAAMYMPNGVREDMWTPEGTGRDFQLSPTLQPLEDLKSEILVLTNLWNQASKGGEGHYVKISGFLTCTTITKTLGVDVSCNGVSMDQMAAQSSGKQTPLASLELGITPVSTGVDKNVGYTRVYGSHIAWSGPTSPLAREINPRLVFERLFRATGPQGDSARRDAQLLDSVMEDAKQLRQSLGAADRQRMEEYLSVVRSLEQRLERSSQPRENPWKAKASIDASAKPEGIPKDYAEHVRLMLDMIALGFQTDTTRVATFMFANEVSNQNFSFVPGVSGSHHSLSHHEKDADKLRQYQLINRWHIEQYAYLMRKLRAMKEGETNVLDSSMVLIGAGIRDGNKHDPHNMPLVLGGRAGGRIDAGQHLIYTPDSPLSNLYVSMLDAFGTPVERFADSTGRLPGVLA